MLNNLINEATINTSHIQRDEEFPQAPEKVVFSINRESDQQALSDTFTRGESNINTTRDGLASDGRLEAIKTERVTTR